MAYTILGLLLGGRGGWVLVVAGLAAVLGTPDPVSAQSTVPRTSTPTAESLALCEKADGLDDAERQVLLSRALALAEEAASR